MPEKKTYALTAKYKRESVEIVCAISQSRSGHFMTVPIRFMLRCTYSHRTHSACTQYNIERYVLNIMSCVCVYVLYCITYRCV